VPDWRPRHDPMVVFSGRAGTTARLAHRAGVGLSGSAGPFPCHAVKGRRPADPGGAAARSRRNCDMEREREGEILAGAAAQLVAGAGSRGAERVLRETGRGGGRSSTGGSGGGCWREGTVQAVATGAPAPRRRRRRPARPELRAARRRRRRPAWPEAGHHHSATRIQAWSGGRKEGGCGWGWMDRIEVGKS
jgi:hypothetical protein